MKGEKDNPVCGFSLSALSILKQYTTDFKTYNILNDPSLRQELKAYSKWPTYPQLYINQELVGGSDILKQLHTANQLKGLIGS